MQNISRGGVLTIWNTEEFLDVQFRVGDKYPLEIRFSEHHASAANGLSCVGTVVRVAMDRRHVAFRISKPRMGPLGLPADLPGIALSSRVM